MSVERQIQSTPEGDEIILNPANRFGAVFFQSIWVIGTLALFYWAAPSILAYFRTGEITGALKYLERFHWSPMGMKAAIILFCLFVAWWGLGGIYEILKALLKRDRFLLRSDAIVVQRRAVLTREVKIFSYEPMALRLRSLDGGIEAKTTGGSKLLTDCGTDEDRKWLLELLQERYRTPSELPAVENAKDRVGTYIVKKLPGGVTRITSSGLSTVGCSVMAGVLSVILIGFAVRFFLKGSGAGLPLIIFAIGLGLIGLSVLNKRMVEASRGKLRVRWSSPVGNILKRFVSPENMMLKFQFGEGYYERETGSLCIKVTRSQKGSTNYGIALVQIPPAENSKQEDLIQENAKMPDDPSQEEDSEEEDLDDEDLDEDEEDGTQYQEDLVLDIHGEASEHTADYLLRVLSEATGFPTTK